MNFLHPFHIPIAMLISQDCPFRNILRRCEKTICLEISSRLAIMGGKKRSRIKTTTTKAKVNACKVLPCLRNEEGDTVVSLDKLNKNTVKTQYQE